ncbi:MAG: hypothetical protein R3B98_01305 [Hyphomonas sp.]
MRVAAIAIAAILAAAPAALADEAGADLCGFRIEGLTLASTHDEIAAVFGPRGWHDLSHPGPTPGNFQRVQADIFDKDRATDDMLASKDDPDGPIGRFSLSRLPTPEGLDPMGIGYSDYSATPPYDTAQALCARFSGPDYYATGCRMSPNQTAFGVTFEPAHPTTDGWCQVSFSAVLTSGRAQDVSYGVSRHYTLPKRAMRAMSAEDRIAVSRAAGDSARAAGGGRTGGGRTAQPSGTSQPH